MMRLVMVMMIIIIIRCSSNYCLQWEGERGPRCDGKRQVCKISAVFIVIVIAISSLLLLLMTVLSFPVPRWQ